MSPISVNSANISKFITKMTKHDAMAPIVALEATVVSGRTYQAYKRGKGDEARERFIEETMGSITWLCGVKALNALGDKILAKILKNNRNFDVGTDTVLRRPFDNFMKKVNPKGFTPTGVALMKSGKVLTSILIANLIIGFVVPKLNQALTRKVKHEQNQLKKAKEQKQDEKQIQNQAQNTAFKGGAMGAINAFTNIIENTNTGQLLSSDVGTTGGRIYNARRNEERREIAIRDIGSIYFYMWATGHIGKLLNYVESGNARRLNPTTAGILDKYLNDFMDESGQSEMSVEEFKKAVLGNQSEVKLPEGIPFETKKQSFMSKLFKKQPLEVAKVSDLKNIINDEEIMQRIIGMSKLQPERAGDAVVTKQQIIDAFNKAEINNPELLQNVFSEFTGGKLKDASKSAVEYVGGASTDEFRFIKNKKLYKLKAEMEHYVEALCKMAKNGKVDKKLIEAAKKKNITMSGINFAAGFLVSAAFLSTLIPKFQYYITRKRTGVDAFPGIYDYEHHKEQEF